MDIITYALIVWFGNALPTALLEGNCGRCVVCAQRYSRMINRCAFTVNWAGEDLRVQLSGTASISLCACSFCLLVDVCNFRSVVLHWLAIPLPWRDVTSEQSNGPVLPDCNRHGCSDARLFCKSKQVKFAENTQGWQHCMVAVYGFTCRQTRPIPIRKRFVTSCFKRGNRSTRIASRWAATAANLKSLGP